MQSWQDPFRLITILKAPRVASGGAESDILEIQDRRNYPPHTSDLSGDSWGIQDSPPFPSLSWPAPLAGIVGQFTGFHFSTWPRISPPGCSLVCTLKYHLPASRSFAWSAVRVAVPLIGLTMGVSLIGTCGPPFSPGIAGP